ncbi:MAG: hypothetical protein M3Q07_28885 [Pseudobdellovibrionaceae bacterium]|nr:hypothetical protein [Pseudobdellovibrionaceae bacterium]
MDSKKIITALAVLALGVGCSKGRKQYQAPGDQRIDKSADPTPTVVPAAPTNSGAGLIDGWYLEPTPAEEAKKLSEAIYSPIILGTGLAGVDISMDRTAIETKIGQPDYVSQDSNLRPVAVYGGRSFLIFYDRVSKNKVSMLLAGNGYLGAISEFGLKVGTDLAPIIDAEGGNDALLKKMYKSFNPAVEDCVASRLCRTVNGDGLSLLLLTNAVQILYQNDPTKTEKKIFEIRVLSRTPDAGNYEGPWTFDLLSGVMRLDGGSEAPVLTTATSTWADIRAAGQLEGRVEPRDFGRSITRFSVGLSNDVGFSFARSQVKDSSARAPLDTDKLTEISTGDSFNGFVSAGQDQLQYQLCKVQNDTEATGQEARVVALNTSFLTSSADGNLVASPDKPSEQTRWLASVVPSSAATENCVLVPLKTDLAATFQSSFRALVESQYGEWLAKSTEESIFTVQISTTNSNVTFKSVYDVAQKSDPLPGEADSSLGFGKTIFNATYDAVLKSAKNSQQNVVEYVPGGFLSLEEKSTFIKAFSIYTDDTLKTGLEVRVYYFESSKTLLFATSAVGEDVHSNNAGLSVMKKDTSGYSVNLDAAVVVEGLGIGSTVDMDPFDRSLRYAALDFSAETAATEYAMYAERFVLNGTDGTSVVSRTYDVVMDARGLDILGKRTGGRSESVSTVEIQGLGLSRFPNGTALSITCASEKQTLKVGDDFAKAYDTVKNCRRFLTPGYGANRIPSELHLAPEGARKHGLTLAFSEGLLSGFTVYVIN